MAPRVQIEVTSQACAGESVDVARFSLMVFMKKRSTQLGCDGRGGKRQPVLCLGTGKDGVRWHVGELLGQDREAPSRCGSVRIGSALGL